VSFLFLDRGGIVNNFSKFAGGYHKPARTNEVITLQFVCQISLTLWAFVFSEVAPLDHILYFLPK